METALLDQAVEFVEKVNRRGRARGLERRRTGTPAGA
jgi:hypothetical protein